MTADPCRRAGGAPCPHSPTHGLYSTYVNHTCRCGECRRAAREYNRGRLERECRKVHEVCPHSDLVHGRLGTYNHHGCRCEACTRAHRAYARELRTRRRARLSRGDDSQVRHGTWMGYDHWGCRCRECRLAGSRRYRAANRRRRGPQGGQGVG